MEKSKLLKFVQKYHLNGLVSSVKWEFGGSNLKTAFISDDKTVLGSVSLKGIDFESVDLNIYDTAKLVKMFGVLGETVNLKINKLGDEKILSVTIDDGSTSVNYVTAEPASIPVVPTLNALPAFNATVVLDQAFTSKFIKAKSALTDENVFTFISNGKDSKIVLGYSKNNTNRISIDVDATVSGNMGISFSANYLKEILNANKEFDAVMNISSEGLAHIKYDIGDFEADYYFSTLGTV